MIYMVNLEKKRFYWLMLQQDLFDTWCVRKIYGGLTNKHKREVWVPYANKLAASQALTEIEYVRRQRGYIYAEMEDVAYFNLKPQTVTEVLASKPVIPHHLTSLAELAI